MIAPITRVANTTSLGVKATLHAEEEMMTSGKDLFFILLIFYAIVIGVICLLVFAL